MAKPASSYLIRFNRTFIWVSLALFVFFAFCGYGTVNPNLVSRLTGGLMNRDLSIYLHMTLAPWVLILLMIHILIEFRFVLIRWGVQQGRLLDAFIILVGALVTSVILVMQYFNG